MSARLAGGLLSLTGAWIRNKQGQEDLGGDLQIIGAWLGLVALLGAREG